MKENIHESRVTAGYVSKYQLAQDFNSHPRTIERWVNQPDGLPFVKVGGKMLFNIESVRSWMKRREQQRNPSRRVA